jgi:hypothetical protein
MGHRVRVHTPDEARAMLELEQATNEYQRAEMQLALARHNYERLCEERAEARRRGPLRLLPPPEPDRQHA